MFKSAVPNFRFPGFTPGISSTVTFASFIMYAKYTTGDINYQRLRAATGEGIRPVRLDPETDLIQLLGLLLGKFAQRSRCKEKASPVW